MTHEPPASVEREKLLPCPLKVGDQVFVDADKLPLSYREDWRGVEAYVVAIKFDPNMEGDYDIQISERWPPRVGSDWVDGWEVGSLILLSAPTVPDAVAAGPLSPVSDVRADCADCGGQYDVQMGATIHADVCQARPALSTPPARPGREEIAAIEAAIHATEYKYFGDYEMSGDQREAVDQLVLTARRYLGVGDQWSAALADVPSGWSWSIGQMMGLPEAMRYRCFLNDHNTTDGKAVRHVCEDRESPVAAIRAAIDKARALFDGASA